MLSILHEEIKNCTNCDLYKSMPFKPVTGFGNPNANIMLIGEAPGEKESIIEEPFMGDAGMMLDKLLGDAGIDRKTTYIANIVNCRPFEGKRNRTPTAKEIKACCGWIFKQIEEIKPKLIFTLGKIPTYTILKLKSTIKLADYIGKEIPVEFTNCKSIVIPNYHPSFCLVYGRKTINQTIETFKKGLSYA